MSDWKSFSLGEVANIMNVKNISGKKLPYLTVKYLRGGNEKNFVEFGNYVDKGSKVILVDGENSGEIFSIKEEGYLGSTLRKLNIYKNVDEDFIMYFIATKKMLYSTNKTGTAIPHLSKDIFYSTKINLPPLETQKKIAAVLSALDDKIELNNAINRNLEEQAQAIFKNMFPAVISNEISIGEYVTPKRGKGLLVKDTICGAVPVVAGGLEPATYHNESNTSAPVLTISASGANAGYVRLWNIPVWSSDSSFIDSSMTEDVYFWYVMLKLRQKEIFDSQMGTAQPHIYPKHIAKLPIKKLDGHIIKEFTKRVTPLFSMIGANTQENKKLGELRDLLLPRLMNEEIDVSKVEI